MMSSCLEDDDKLYVFLILSNSVKLHLLYFYVVVVLLGISSITSRFRIEICTYRGLPFSNCLFMASLHMASLAHNLTSSMSDCLSPYSHVIKKIHGNYELNTFIRLKTCFLINSSCKKFKPCFGYHAVVQLFILLHYYYGLLFDEISLLLLLSG